MNDKNPREKTRNGFTLTELLVVVGIIALILAILLPVFSSVRERGRRATCQNNQRQIALAFQQYVQDNNGQYPISSLWESAIFPYVKDDQVYRCPSFGSDRLWRAGQIYSLGYGTTADYTFNWTRLNIVVPPFPSRTMRGVRESALATPATIYLTMDASWLTYSDGVCHYCEEGISGSNVHAGGGNYSFVDGHVQWLKPGIYETTIDPMNGPLPSPFHWH